MALALCTTSHSPLMDINEPGGDVRAAVDAAYAEARARIAEFDPELVVIFAPDHYNGFFYELMPPFCVAAGATSVGDYGTRAGPLDVDHDASYAIAQAVLDAGVDVAYSERMRVDHGIAQPLTLLLGGIAARPVVPIFINAIAEPLGPPRRSVRLGRAVGAAALRTARRVLLIGSGGLSHDPPVPDLKTAPPPLADHLITGRHPAPRGRREQRIVRLARAFAAETAAVETAAVETAAADTAAADTAAADTAGSATGMRALNPAWDRHVMRVLAAGDLAEVDTWTSDEIAAAGGRSAHEIRTWIAAYGALSAAGPYTVTSSFYRAIPEWIAGFGITTARTTTRRDPPHRPNGESMRHGTPGTAPR